MIRPAILAMMGAAGRVAVTNLLTANVASGTDTLATATGFIATNMTISSSTDWAMTGSRSLKAVANLSVTSCYPQVGGHFFQGDVVVTPGQVYTFRVSLWSDVATPPLYAVVRFFEENGTTYVGNAYGVPVSPTTTPATASVTSTVPAGAYRASAYIFPSGGGQAVPWTAGNYVHLDDLGFWEGDSLTWAMPPA